MKDEKMQRIESLNHRIIESLKGPTERVPWAFFDNDSMIQCSDDSIHRAFTLVELLTVLIIITILVGILIPTVSRVRQRAYNTGVQAQIAQLRQAIDQYYADFNAYPGPIPNVALGTNEITDKIVIDTNYTGVVPSQFGNNQNWLPYVTGPEDLTLGLLGGLHLVTTPGGPRGGAGATVIAYNPTLVAQGPQVMNTALPKKFGAYIDNGDLSDAFKSTQNGMYSDAVVLLDPNSKVGIHDSPIPEILDRFPNRMPILYLRANVGATMYLTNGNYPSALSDAQNPVVINGTDSQYITATGQNTSKTQPIIRYAEYDISQIIAYTEGAPNTHLAIGEGKTMPTYVGWGTPPSGPNGSSFPFHGLQTIGATSPTAVLNASNVPTGSAYKYPYPAYPYFTDPNSPAYTNTNNTVTLPYARAKDTYILISAGVDRIYGTADDITSFGDVRP